MHEGVAGLESVRLTAVAPQSTPAMSSEDPAPPVASKNVQLVGTCLPRGQEG